MDRFGDSREKGKGVRLDLDFLIPQESKTRRRAHSRRRRIVNSHDKMRRSVRFLPRLGGTLHPGKRRLISGKIYAMPKEPREIVEFLQASQMAFSPVKRGSWLAKDGTETVVSVRAVPVAAHRGSRDAGERRSESGFQALP